MNQLVDYALRYLAAGLSVVPVRSNKKSVGSWKKCQYVRLTEPEARQAFTWSSTKGVGIICGDISGNLEVIDLDVKNDPAGNLYERFISATQQHLPGIIPQLVIARTRGNGYHVFYKCDRVGQNTVLAKQAVAGSILHPTGNPLVLIETRGKGGYVVVEPSEGYTVCSGSLEKISVIAPEERDALLAIGRSFNTYVPFRTQYERKYPTRPLKPAGSPLDDYDERGSVIELLVRHEWKIIRRTAIRTFFRRPGETHHDTSGDFHHGLNLFTVFTTSTVFTAQKGYRPSAVYAILECGGDFILAAKRLVSMGFGIPYVKLVA